MVTEEGGTGLWPWGGTGLCVGGTGGKLVATGLKPALLGTAVFIKCGEGPGTTETEGTAVAIICC